MDVSAWALGSSGAWSGTSRVSPSSLQREIDIEVVVAQCMLYPIAAVQPRWRAPIARAALVSTRR